MHFPWTHLRPASSTVHFEESIITGTREISGSAAIRFRNFTIVGSPSISASSTLMSMTLAPLSTCWRAMARQASQSPAFRAFANLGEPVMLVRSPITMNCEAETGDSLGIGRPTASGDDEPLEAAQASWRPPAPSAAGEGMGCTASAIAAMCAGVDPQHPPTMLTQPFDANSPRTEAMSAGASS